MKLVISQAKLDETVRAAKRFPGMRIGQHVFNALIADSCLANRADTSRLLAPNGGIYLPCEDCGLILEVPSNTVSHLCPDCYTGESSDEEGSNYHEQFQYAAGYHN